MGAGKGAGAGRAESRAGPAERGGRRGEANTETRPLPPAALTAARSPGTTASRPLPPLPLLALRSPFSPPPGRGGSSASRMPGAEQEQEQDGAR